jgi:hypothetical protein
VNRLRKIISLLLRPYAALQCKIRDQENKLMLFDRDQFDALRQKLDCYNSKIAPLSKRQTTTKPRRRL